MLIYNKVIHPFCLLIGFQQYAQGGPTIVEIKKKKEKIRDTINLGGTTMHVACTSKFLRLTQSTI